MGILQFYELNYENYLRNIIKLISLNMKNQLKGFIYLLAELWSHLSTSTTFNLVLVLKCVN